MAYRIFESIRFLPVFHRRLEFALEVRRALLADPPDVVAVELPGTWREPILQAANRLPCLSLILGEAEGGHLHLPCEPTDAGFEALRTARELGLPVELIDLDVEQYPLIEEPLPDSHAVRRLGYRAFLDAYYAELGGDAAPRSPLDEQRETMMAYALQQVAQGRRVACVLGAAHLPGVLARLERPQPRPFARARPRELKLYNWSERSSREFMSEAPFLAAAYEHARPVEGRRGRTQGPPTLPPALPPGLAAFDREAESEALLREAAEVYRERYGSEVTPAQFRTLATFAKKYALVEGQLVPDLFQLATAARGAVDDEYAFELWELGIRYPWQDGSGLLPTLDLDEAYAAVAGRRMTLRRKVRRRRPVLAGFDERERLRERQPGEWKSKWSGAYICSHPPEDLVIEGYGQHLKQVAKGMLQAERTRVEPFQVSLKDGLDVRETLRNWHQGRLYVRETLPLAGEVGSLVVIFDEDRPPRGSAGEEPRERYPWRVTWLGEHEQESDMALYATPAGEHVIGPGISRCEYGGFLMTYPPRRLFDVWRDPFFDAARTKAERLLMAGLDYSVEPLVLYVAARPPRPWFRSLAARMGRKLVHVPLGQLLPDTLRKIRTFHVLEGQHVREYAAEYIR